MATVNSNTVSLTLTSTWTCTWADDDHNSTYVSKASNTDAQAANFSATVPAGSTINSMYLYTTWSNTGTVQTASVNDAALGASVDVRAVSTWAHTYKWRASATAMSSQGNYSRYMYVSAYISVDYTPPTAASVWSVLLDNGAGTIYRGAGAGISLTWSAANGTNNAITSYSVQRSDNDGAWYDAGSGWHRTVYAHGTPGVKSRWRVYANAPYGSNDWQYSPYVYSYSAVNAPTSVSLSPATRYPGESFGLSWSGASGGVGTSVASYHIYQNGSYLTATAGTSITLTAPAAGTYSYTVYSISNVSGYNSGASSSATLTVNIPYSSCTPPSAVTTPNNVLPSTDYTLSWSGANAGTQNAITGYQVYRASTENGSYIAFGSTVTGTSLTVTSHATNGSSYYYKVVTIGTVSGYDSGLSTAYATMTTNVGVVTAPTSLTAAPAIFADSVTLSWSGATAGTNNAITGYTVEYQTGDGATWASTVVSSASTSSVIDTSALTRGHYLRFRVLTTGQRSNSAYTAWSASARKNQLPPVPTVSYPKTGTTTYNPRPYFKTVLGTEPDGQAQTVEYSVDGGAYVSSSGGIIRISLAAGAHTIAFRAFDGLDGRSATASVTITVAATNYTDTIAKGTIVKAVHYNEVHACLNALCGYYGLAAWTTTVGTVVSTTDLNAIQDKISSVALLNSVPFSKLNFARNMPILASDINYLRNAIQGL